MFRYWLQGGRITIGFLGAAQLDKFGNINTTVIGDYSGPKTRLPGGGGAPEIASSAKQVYITMKQSLRGMVEKIDFFTSFGHGSGGNERKSRNINTEGPSLLITDLAIWKPDPISKEFTVHSLHTGVSKEMVQDSCGWKVKYSDNIEVTEPPTELELKTLSGSVGPSVVDIRSLYSNLGIFTYDPGYGSTSKMITESAVCLLKDANDLEGGIYTPASSLGTKIIKRLEDNAGLTFKIE